MNDVRKFCMYVQFIVHNICGDFVPQKLLFVRYIC